MIMITQALANRYLVGRTIASVSVEYSTSDHYPPAHDVSTIVFTDGSCIVLGVAEMESEYAVTACRLKKEKR